MRCRVAAKLGHSILAWRRVPTNNYNLGDSAKSTEPSVEQCFLSKSSAPQTTSPDPEAQVHATSEAACCALLYPASKHGCGYTCCMRHLCMP